MGRRNNNNRPKLHSPQMAHSCSVSLSAICRLKKHRWAQKGAPTMSVQTAGSGQLECEKAGLPDNQ